MQHFLQNMSNGKRVRFEQDAADREWSNKVLREVIFPEVYERYGPNAEPNKQLPAIVLEDLRRQVYRGEQEEGVKPHGIVNCKLPQCKKVRRKSASNDEPNQHGCVTEGP